MIATVNPVNPEKHEIALMPPLDWNASADNIQLFAGAIGYRSQLWRALEEPGVIGVGAHFRPCAAG